MIDFSAHSCLCHTGLQGTYVTETCTVLCCVGVREASVMLQTLQETSLSGNWQSSVLKNWNALYWRRKPNTGMLCPFMPSVLWRCSLGGRKGIRPVKTEWWGAGVVICLERGADLHIAQMMPLPLTVSCSSNIQIGFTFWYRLTWVVPDKGPLNGCVYLAYK